MSIFPLFLWLLTCFSLVLARFEPYEVLGVHRRANNQEIKKAYKAKIRQWHPDLNLDPESQAKFIEVNTAYELLSDPDRRRSYDNHGITEDSPNFRKVSCFMVYWFWTLRSRLNHDLHSFLSILCLEPIYTNLGTNYKVDRNRID